VQNWDCYDKNHFVIFDRRGSKKWFSLPWDLDRTFGDHWRESFDSADLPILLGTRQRPRSASWNRLQDRFFSEPALRARFLDRLAELLEKEFTTDKLFPILEHTVQLSSCSQSALSLPVRQAIDDYLDVWLRRGHDWGYWMEQVALARADGDTRIRARSSVRICAGV